eukprot:6703727-Pyramimonas_sp.AAC.1
MTENWLQILQDGGYEVDFSECEWSSTSFPEASCWNESVSIQGHEIRRVPKTEGIKILGAMLSHDGRDDVTLEYRISQAWKSWFKWRSVFCQHHAPLEKRPLLRDSVIRSSLFWGAK